jgi:ABC-2 type transport system ATP-binding protein
VLVIGRGHLVADMPMEAFTQRSTQSHVRVVSPKVHDLMPHLQARGAMVTNGTPNELTVTGLDSAAIGAIAFEQMIPLAELSTQRASLETAFMELTHDSVQYRAASQPAHNVSTIQPVPRELAVERIS